MFCMNDGKIRCVLFVHCRYKEVGPDASVGTTGAPSLYGVPGPVERAMPDPDDDVDVIEPEELDGPPAEEVEVVPGPLVVLVLDADAAVAAFSSACACAVAAAIALRMAAAWASAVPSFTARTNSLGGAQTGDEDDEKEGEKNMKARESELGRG